LEGSCSVPRVGERRRDVIQQCGQEVKKGGLSFCPGGRDVRKKP